MLLTTVTVIAQKWIVKSHLDDFGDPINSKYVTQLVTGTCGSISPTKIRFLFSIDLPISSQRFFKVLIYNPNGKLNILNMLSTELLSSRDSLYLRYKIDGKEHTLGIYKAQSLSALYIPRPTLTNILLNNSEPIKCIVVKAEIFYKEIRSRSNVYHFTLYPANFKEVYYRNK